MNWPDFLLAGVDVWQCQHQKCYPSHQQTSSPEEVGGSSGKVLFSFCCAPILQLVVLLLTLLCCCFFKVGSVWESTCWLPGDKENGISTLLLYFLCWLAGHPFQRESSQRGIDWKTWTIFPSPLCFVRKSMHSYNLSCVFYRFRSIYPNYLTTCQILSFPIAKSWIILNMQLACTVRRGNTSPSWPNVAVRGR